MASVSLWKRSWSFCRNGFFQFRREQVGEMGFHGKARFQGAECCVGLNLGCIGIEFFPPDQSVLLALFYNPLAQSGGRHQCHTGCEYESSSNDRVRAPRNHIPDTSGRLTDPPPGASASARNEYPQKTLSVAA